MPIRTPTITTIMSAKRTLSLNLEILLDSALLSISEIFSYSGWSFYNCTSLESITIPEGASAIFDGGSIFFDDNEHHTITVNAPKGFTIPGYALNGDVEIVYSYPNESNDNGMIFLAIGVIIAAIVAIVIFVMYKRKNSSS